MIWWLNSSCLFQGQLIENQPPLYVGVYLDDIIYFLVSSEAEQQFEETFKSKINIRFNSNIHKEKI